MPNHYRSIFLSDVHLGSRACQADHLCHFLKHNTCDTLYLVGDIIDGWALRRRWHFPQSHANVLRRILTAAKRGTTVYYVLGNHDEFLRKYLKYQISIGGVSIVNEVTHHSVTGERYLVTHGDFFDPIMNQAKWLMHVGDFAYNTVIWFNLHLNWFRLKLGLRPWSLSKYLKHRTKQAVNFIGDYERQLSSHCLNNGFDGIICGHIHTPADRMIDGIRYINTGDWCENTTVVVEHLDGRLELIHLSN